MAWRAREGDDEASGTARSSRTRAVLAAATRRPGAERRQPPPHVRRAHEPVARALLVAAALADDRVVRREAFAPCPRQAPSRRRRGGPARAAQFEDRRAVTLDPE